jgi:membrane protein DedA with SNARE-associated domain
VNISIADIPAIAGHAPALQALVIILGTFVLEDAATVLAAMDAQSGDVSKLLALGALYAGVVLGDLGLYGLGYLAARWPWAARLLPPPRHAQGRAWLRARTMRVVFASRFIPGARLPTYTACGFFGVGLRRFAFAAIAATLVWTSLLFGVSLHVGSALIHVLGPWRWAGAVGFAAAMVLLGRVLARAGASP